MKSLSDKRIAVFGAGAVGCYFGRFFADAGFDIDFAARVRRLEDLKKYGLRVRAPDGGFSVTPVKAIPRLSGVYDVILICVKSQNTEEAARAALGSLAPGGFAVSLQNGTDNPAIIARVLGAENVVSAAVYLTASFDGSGVLTYEAPGKIIYGAAGEDNARAAGEFGRLLEIAGVPHKKSENIKREQWRKLCLNAAVNPLSAILRADFGRLFSDADSRALSEKLFLEAREAAFFEGEDLNSYSFQSVERQCVANPRFKTSMLQDVEANKRPEVDAILKPVLDAYGRKGLVPPYTDAVYKIMRAKFGHWFQISPRLAADVLVACGREVLLIERKNEPYGWAVPGGMVDLGETLETAAARELKEETGIDAAPEKISLLGVYSDPSRDSRGHTVSAVYVYEVAEKPDFKAADDAGNARFFNVDELPENLAFDHRKVIADYRSRYGL